MKLYQFDYQVSLLIVHNLTFSEIKVLPHIQKTGLVLKFDIFPTYYHFLLLISALWLDRMKLFVSMTSGHIRCMDIVQGRWHCVDVDVTVSKTTYICHVSVAMSVTLLVCLYHRYVGLSYTFVNVANMCQPYCRST